MPGLMSALRILFVTNLRKSTLETPPKTVKTVFDVASSRKMNYVTSPCSQIIPTRKKEPVLEFLKIEIAQKPVHVYLC